MKDVKKTKVPLPPSKPKKKSQDVPSKPQLSQEFVDSDSDSASERTARPKKSEKPKATIGIHVNGVPKQKTKSSKADATASNSSSKQTAPPTKKPTPKQIVTQRDAADLSSSEVSDDDDAPTRDIQTKLSGNEAKKDESSDSDSSNTASSDSSSEESDSDDAPQAARNPAPSQPQTQAPTQSHAVDFRPTKAFVPPKGFNPVPLNDKTISRLSTSLFDNLEGKQVWHITAPSGVSLKDLKELAMDKIKGGEAVLSHRGTDYGFSELDKSDDGTRQVFVPRKDRMKPVSVRIEQTLRLRSVVRLPKLSSLQADPKTGSATAFSITRSTIRAPRPPVTGLKMRFLPTGFSGTDPGTMGDSGDEAEPARATAVLGMPESSKLSKKQKRKHADVNGPETGEAPSKKTKQDQDSEEARRKAEKKAKKEKKRAKEAASAGL